MRVLFNVSFNKSSCSYELEKLSFPKLNQLVRYTLGKDVEGVEWSTVRSVGRFLPILETFHKGKAGVCDNLNLPQACRFEGRVR